MPMTYLSHQPERFDMQTIQSSRELVSTPAGPADTATSTGSGVNLRAFLALLWRRRLTMLLVLLLVGATVGIGLVAVQREYTATARVAAMPPQELSESPANYIDLLGTLADVAESRPVLGEVAKAIGDRPLGDLRDHVRGSVVAGTVLIQVSATDSDPVKAAQIANAVVAALPDHAPSSGTFLFNTTEPAAVPTSFTSPNIKITVLAGLLLALALAVAAAVLKDKATRTVDTPDELAELGGSAVLGVLGRPGDADGVPALDPDSDEFGGLRALRVALEFASSEHPTRTLVVSPTAGPDPWPGWLEVNLAVTLAEVGHRVLLIDADRGDRARHPVLDVPDAPGLYDLLAGTAELPAASIEGPVDGVTVVPLGNADQVAPSLLEMRFHRLIAEIDERYDVILIHAASVAESEDARIMAIDGALVLTVPAGRVKPRILERTAAQLRGIRIRVAGTVLLGARSGKKQARARR